MYVCMHVCVYVRTLIMFSCVGRGKCNAAIVSQYYPPSPCVCSLYIVMSLGLAYQITTNKHSHSAKAGTILVFNRS